MSSGFGIVRAVNSGDSVSIYETVRVNGPPPVREISLSNVQAPKLGYNNAEDHPWAWQSRDFLRELSIGKKVKFSVEHKTANGREYGSVETDAGVNLGVAISEAGWAEIRSPPEGKEPRTEEHKMMLDNQKNAKEQKIGIWQEDQSTANPRSNVQKLSTMEIYDQYKEKSMEAIVEYVVDANSVVVLLKDAMQKIRVRFAGISAPRVPSKRRQEEGENPEPYALEARFFVERHLLNRTVRLVITAPGESNGPEEFFGSVELAGRSVSGQLLRNGFAKLLEWSAKPEEVKELQEAQEQAMAKKMRIWQYASAREAQKSKTSWSGRVREIRDSSSLVVEDPLTNERKFVILSNVKAPRMGRTDPEPYAYQAREVLRKKVLGKKVQVVLDYEKNEREYVTVLLEGKSIALLLVERGYARVTSYEGDAKSSAYQELTIAENRARSQNKNIWSKKSAPVYRVTDTTLRSTESEKRESKKKAQQFVGALQRAGRLSGIVEHVFNGNRFKVSIPSENVIIAFGLEAVRTPSTRGEDNESFGKEVFDFVYDKLYQRDVEVLVDSIDQGGNFFGSLFIGARNFGVSLLEMGYARLNSSTVDYTNYAVEYKRAEEEAKSKGIRIWANFKEEKASKESESETKKIRVYKVAVTEVVDGNWFYLQMTEDQSVLQLIMKELNEEDHPIIPNLQIKRGGLYTAKMPDNKWYRVKVEKLEGPKVMAVCVDYGNGIALTRNDLRPLSAKLASAPLQAKECKLAYLEIPSASEEYGVEAAEYFYSLAMDKPLLASVEYVEGTISYVGLGDGETLINFQMAEAGFGVVPKKVRVNDPRKAKLIENLQQKQNEAKRTRRGRWEYGDFLGDEL